MSSVVLVLLIAQGSLLVAKNGGFGRSDLIGPVATTRTNQAYRRAQPSRSEASEKVLDESLDEAEVDARHSTGALEFGTVSSRQAPTLPRYSRLELFEYWLLCVYRQKTATCPE